LKIASQQAHFKELRKRHSFFVYQKYSIRIENESLLMKFNFFLANNIRFEPEIRIPARPFFRWSDIPKPVLEQFVFHIGMVELISYWKCACPQLVIIRPFRLDAWQIAWWKKLYYNGLGEFFYLNGINTNLEDFMQINPEGFDAVAPADVGLHNSGIVPVGGGKDSVVSLELLKRQGIDYIPFIINPRQASSACVATAGFSTNQTAIAERSLDPQLLALNDKGYLNGHTPFSALLAFVSATIALGSRSKFIILSNESSASEATVEGTQINHQYSKSVEFEIDFRKYCRKYLHPEMEYFSLLRPLSELQIGRLFSNYPAYFPHFKSCNVGSKTDSWCCTCSKCLFTWLMLAPFVDSKVLQNTFGQNLLQNPDLMPVLKQLSGQAETKPFECVGTVEEVNIALDHLMLAYKDNMPPLLQGIERPAFAQAGSTPDLENALKHFDRHNYLPKAFVQLVREALYD
jgi:UDP-N-acetyl-alpha-D-muramoyl-L-alanyl-L-glutamate epimerase